MSAFASWVRPLYLYLACLVSMIVFIIGATTIGNELMRRYIFGLETSYYESPSQGCEYIFTADELPEYEYYPGGPRPVKRAPASVTKDLTTEERQAGFDRCVTAREEVIQHRSKYDLANKVSRGTTMIIIAIPLFWLHWRIVHENNRRYHD